MYYGIETTLCLYDLMFKFIYEFASFQSKSDIERPSKNNKNWLTGVIRSTA